MVHSFFISGSGSFQKCCHFGGVQEAILSVLWVSVPAGHIKTSDKALTALNKQFEQDHLKYF